MKRPRVDLHTHTCYSDGKLTPAALLEKADDAGLRVLALTDHDTLAGWDAAQEVASMPVDLVPGVELSVTAGDREVHLLGYGFDPAHGGLRDHLERFTRVRRERARKMVEKLNAAGVSITMDAVQRAAAGADALGRPHVAAALIEAGHTASYDAAFEQYLGNDGPAFVAKPQFAAADALGLLHDAGGIGVLAHPGHWTSGRTLHLLRRAGLDGLEVWHPSHDASLVSYYQHLARDFDLVSTGGSDYHGLGPDDEAHFGTYGLTWTEWKRVRAVIG